jgi:hypothetical protein
MIPYDSLSLARQLCVERSHDNPKCLQRTQRMHHIQVENVFSHSPKQQNVRLNKNKSYFLSILSDKDKIFDRWLIHSTFEVQHVNLLSLIPFGRFIHQRDKLLRLFIPMLFNILLRNQQGINLRIGYIDLHLPRPLTAKNITSIMHRGQYPPGSLPSLVLLLRITPIIINLEVGAHEIAPDFAHIAGTIRIELVLIGGYEVV